MIDWYNMQSKMEPATPPGTTTTVNAAMWEESVRAAFTLWADIIKANKTGLKEQDFRNALSGYYSGYHTKVHALAWQLLPDKYKHGSGRPKKPGKTHNTPK